MKHFFDSVDQLPDALWCTGLIIFILLSLLLWVVESVIMVRR